MSQKLKPMISFEDYEMDPSPQVWEKIKEKLPSPAGKKRSWYLWSVAAILAGGLLLSGLFFDIEIKWKQRNTPVTEANNANKNGNAGALPLVPRGFNSGSGNENRTAAVGNARSSVTTMLLTKDKPRDVKSKILPPARPGSANSERKTSSFFTTETAGKEGKQNSPDVTASNTASQTGYRLLSPEKETLKKIPFRDVVLASRKPASPDKLADPPKELMLSPKRSSASRWQFSVLGSLDYCYRNLYFPSSGGNSLSETERDILSANETGIQSFSTAATAGYSFSTHFSVISGLSYFSAGQERNRSEVILSSGLIGSSATEYSVSTSAGNVNGSGQQFNLAYFQNPDSILFNNIAAMPANSTEKSFSLEQQFRFISIPFLAQYQPSEHRFTPFIAMGFSLAYLVEEKLFLNNQELDYQYSPPTNTLLFSAEAQAGIKYRITSHYSFRLQPSFRYGLNSLSTNEQVKWIPYSFGIGFGISYSY